MPFDNLHPGVHIALAKSKMDEAQVARAIASGELTSPQQYGNSWFFNLRITGTGRSYREAHNEHVWRDSSIYLNQNFLNRCNGLPIILEHPNKEMLDSREYHDRNIGSIVYPYIKGDEVWGIGRIIDAPAAHVMAQNQLSTSPAVVFLPRDGNEKIDTGDGKHLLIEGKPSLLDHLAICEEGVWDKGGPPTGVDLTGSRKDSVMPDMEKEEKKEESREDKRGRKDEDVDNFKEAKSEEKKEEREGGEERRDSEGDKIDKLLAGIKTISDRMDAIEADSRRRDDDARSDKRGRKDTDPEKEAEQAAELHQLAKEEEQEAKEEAKEEAEDDRKDKRHDAKRDDDEDEDEEKKMPWDKGERKEGESDSAYSKRMDSIAAEHDSRYRKRDDESIAAHCDRLDRAYRKDRARCDAQRKLDSVDKLIDMVGKLSSRLDSISSRVEDRSDEDEVAFADARARADSVYEAMGDHAPRPMRGENLIGYRIRLARGLQKHSPVWKDTDLHAVARADTKAFENAEQLIYADATAAARAPTSIPLGTLREVRKRMPYGGEMIEFQGDPLAWMQTFMLPAQGARITRTPGQHMPRE